MPAGVATTIDMDDRPEREAPHHRMAGDREHAARRRHPRPHAGAREGRIAGEASRRTGSTRATSAGWRPATRHRPRPTTAPRRRTRAVDPDHPAERGEGDERNRAIRNAALAELRDQRRAQRMRHQEMRADEAESGEPEQRQRASPPIRLRQRRAATGRGSGRAAWSGGSRAAGGRRRSTPLRPRCCISSGSPDQMTTSPRRPRRRLPISPPMPIASAGAEVIIASASPQLTPGRARHLAERDQIAGILALVEQIARVIVVDHADRHLDPGGAHPADVRLGRGELSNAGRQIVDRRGDHRDVRPRRSGRRRSSPRSRRPAPA